MTAIGRVAGLAFATIALSTVTQAHHEPPLQADVRARAEFGVTAPLGVGSSSSIAAQGAVATVPLVGTWKLTSLERAGAGQPLAAVPNPSGILIQDAAGNVIEIVTRAGRAASMDAAEQFMTYEAFWGTYTSDASRSAITYRISGDLDPGRTGQQIVRSYERNGRDLVLTESAAGLGPVSRTTWEKVAELEGLPAYQRDAVGFWQWQSAGRYDANGDNVLPTYRDSSVIVYTPAGLMAVLYLPPTGRKPFAGARPTVGEAQAAMRGAVSYFGPYVVHPKTVYVVHYRIGTSNPAQIGMSQERNFEASDSALVLRFPPTMLNGQQVRNTIFLKRLGGLADMWPEFPR